MRTVLAEQTELYRNYLIEEEKTEATIRKYLFDIASFRSWLSKEELSKTKVLEYKAYLLEWYAVSSVNSIISSLNSFFAYLGWFDLKVKTVKIQRQIFASNEKELTKAEYERLLNAAKNNKRLYLLMQTICSTGIRVSELRHITVEAVVQKQAEINCKGKRRTVFLPNKLCEALKRYIKEQKIKSGPVFVTKNGKPLDRSNIWSDMKKLCKTAGGYPSQRCFHTIYAIFLQELTIVCKRTLYALPIF